MKNGLYAIVKTSKGNITLNLEFEKTPATVGNFVALCEGEMKNSSKDLGVPYYNNLKFHRVINDFMVQAGCPLGTGTGNPGYKFDDEFHPELKHDKAGYYLWLMLAQVQMEASFLSLMYQLPGWTINTLFSEVFWREWI
jgi:cyclophilin family peptidyl-prolyl cis-trans isomerase